MIPKIIHYCWFGHNPLPESAKKCIASWRKFLPDYEIWQWSEEPLNENEYEDENRLFDKIQVFDVNIIPYTQQAYEAKKYAFVSDYARFWILYKYGGLYFDTDVEVIKPMDDIIERGPFMGIEIPSENGTMPQIAPGLGMGASVGMAFYEKALEAYSKLTFFNSDGTLNQKTIVKYNTELLEGDGLKAKNELQLVAGTWIYPVDFFNPLDDLTGRLKITENTRSIHWYTKTWLNVNPVRAWLSRMSHRIFGMTLHNIKNSFKK